MASEKPGRKTPQREAASKEAAQATAATRVADVAAGDAVEDAQIADVAAGDAVEDAQIADVAAGKTIEAEQQAERLVAALSQQLILIPGDQLQDLVTNVIKGMRDAIQPGPAAGDVTAAGSHLDRDQARLVLGYDALRTALGRRMAAALVFYRVVSQPQERSGQLQVGIRIAAGPVSHGDWIVIYGGARSQGKFHGEIGRAEYHPDGEGVSWIPVDIPDPVVSRLEVWDSSNRYPIRLGRSLADDARLHGDRARR